MLHGLILAYVLETMEPKLCMYVLCVERSVKDVLICKFWASSDIKNKNMAHNQYPFV